MSFLPPQYRIAYYPALLVFLLTITGCQQNLKAIGTTEGGKVADGNIALSCKLGEAKTAASTAANKSKVILTLDGSASMVGYAKDANSRYIQTLRLLDRVSLAAPGGVEYARIDNSRKSIDRTEFQKSFGTSFYTGQTSKIADAFPDLKTVKGDRLIAVVTDLQPDDGDVNLVSKQILEDYLKRDGYAVAVWGIRSEFAGKVYPPNNAPAYEYTGNVTNGRPFYILLLGRYEAIADFAKTLRSADSNSLLKDRSNLTIFTADRTITSPSYLTAAQDNLPKGVSSPDSLSQDRFLMENGEQPIQFLEINENSNPDKQAIKYTLNYQANPDTAIPTQLEARYQVKKYNEERDKPAFVDSSNKSLVDISSSLANDKLGVEMKFDPTKIDRGLYYLTADLVARSIQVPAAWKEWDDGGKKDGSKTQGLNDFFNSLSINTNSVMKEKSPTVARLCYGIQRN
ncbi:MAG: hypothetical protein LH613_12080 [Chamaesiphon sp.]|nr:hypothetical protein [Chamaesiphon sp.]